MATAGQGLRPVRKNCLQGCPLAAPSCPTSYQGDAPMIIDCHGHSTTEPNDLHRFRAQQTEAAKSKDKSKMPPRAQRKMSDDKIPGSIDKNQHRLHAEP